MGLEYFGDNLTSNVLEMKQEVPQGRLFRYSNLNTQLLGVVLEKATGKHLTQYLQEKLWKYISVQDAEWCLDESGNTKSFCCLFMTTEDLLRVGAMILNNGFINNDMIISDTYLQQMFKPNPFVQFRQKRRQLTENTFYGLHAWVTDVDGVKIHYFNGIMGQFMAIVPEWDLVFTRFGNDEKIDTKSTFEPVVRELALIARRMAMSQFE
ncbi:Beta-lactamase-related domain-containing protein [Entamoeba marina]